MGDLAVPSGAATQLPPIIWPVGSGQSVAITGVWASILAGTSITIEVTQNGVTIPGLSSVVVTTTSTFTSIASFSVNDGDVTTVTPTAVSGSPVGLSLVFATEVTP